MAENRATLPVFTDWEEELAMRRESNLSLQSFHYAGKSGMRRYVHQCIPDRMQC